MKSMGLWQEGDWIAAIAVFVLAVFLTVGAKVAIQKEPEFAGHPKGLYMLFFAEMWERFSYYGMRALLIFYLTQHWLLSDEDASLVYGAYTALVYIAPVVGGYRGTVSQTLEITVLDPRTGDVVTRMPLAPPSACDAAVEAAHAAAPGWARTAPADRAAAVAAAAKAVSAAAEELAELNERETGKPHDDALGGVEAGVGTLVQYSELGPLHGGRVLQSRSAAWRGWPSSAGRWLLQSRRSSRPPRPRSPRVSRSPSRRRGP